MPVITPREVVASGLFDEEWYRETHLSASSRISAVEHYLGIGFRSGHPPSLFFDLNHYAALHPDLDFRRTNPLLHYLQTPAAERVNPHPLFDAAFYRKAVGESLPAEDDAAGHFLREGDAAGKAPHVLFDPAFYLFSNPDVAQAGEPPFHHFLHWGHAEGRSSHPLFNSRWYLERYPEAAAWPYTLQHYLEVGAAQGNWPHPLFDPHWYRSQTDDPVAAANPLTHYLLVGSVDGLSPHPLFDPAWYRRTQLPKDKGGQEPLSHFLTNGAAAGLDPNPLFSIPWYWTCYPDVAEAGINALLHYMEHGVSEDRQPHPAFSTAVYLHDHPECLDTGNVPLVHALEADPPGLGRPAVPVAGTGEVPTRSQRAAPPINSGPEIPAGMKYLADVIASYSDPEVAKRIISYFRIIETLDIGHSASTVTRREKLERLTARMKTLSEAANDSRPIEVSIVVPCYGHIEYTIACFISLLEHKSRFRYEVLIGNDVSPDETGEVFEAVGGILTCITPEKNGGFIKNCNMSAQHAKGKYIVFLNNDTLILDRWLDELITPFERFRKVGLTGSKLLMGNGRLQEAGGIIWCDASGWNFGRNQDSRLPEFNYLKDVDYISGASIAVPTALWRKLGGFDELYLPAYCDDSDLAFALRAEGYRTLYVPSSAVIHHEGVSHGTDTGTGIKAYQLVNQQKFLEKWRQTIEGDQFVNGEQVFVARDRSRSKPHILVIDHYIPQFDKDAGSRTLYEYCRMFVDAGFQVSFWPDNLFHDKTYAKPLQDIGVEILYGPELVNKFPSWISQNGKYLDYIFLSRPHVSEKYIDDIKAHSPAKILFYGHDLHFVRLEKEYAVTRQQELLAEVEFWRRSETRIWQYSDVIYYPAEEEQNFVASQVPDKTARTISIYMYPDEDLAAVRTRLLATMPSAPSLVFVAGFRHRPNADAALWLAREVLPLVKTAVPDVITTMAGSFPPPEVLALGGGDPSIVVTGYISDALLRRVYETSMVAVAPLRFGGGVKGKIVEAMRFGVPIVTTSFGAQGLEAADSFLEIADDPKKFAAGIIRLLGDQNLRRSRALAALEAVGKVYSYSAVVARMARDIPELSVLLDGKGFFARSGPQTKTPKAGKMPGSEIGLFAGRRR